MYRSLRPLQNHKLQARGLTFHVYRWPGANPDPLVLLHGWGDTGETYQFLVDCFAADRTCVAIDMRGFGRTQRPVDGYWFPDYLADLDALLDQLAPEAPIDLVGHSMGGNIAMLYSGVRPQRIRRLVSLEGFGMARTTPDQAPARYAQWLDEVKQGVEFTVYESYEQLVRVLARRNPRTPRDRVEFIARSWGQAERRRQDRAARRSETQTIESRAVLTRAGRSVLASDRGAGVVRAGRSVRPGEAHGR